MDKRVVKTRHLIYQAFAKVLKEKGYPDAVLKETGLVTITEKGGRDKFWNRVMFPIMDTGNRVIGFGGRVLGQGEPKYINSQETKIFDKSRSLYALNRARNRAVANGRSCGVRFEYWPGTKYEYDPGIVNSRILRLGRWFDPVTDILFRPFCKSPERGVLPAISALSSPERNRYFVGNRCLEMPRRYIDPDKDRRLWEETLGILQSTGVEGLG